MDEFKCFVQGASRLKRQVQQNGKAIFVEQKKYHSLKEKNEITVLFNKRKMVEHKNPITIYFLKAYEKT